MQIAYKKYFLLFTIILYGTILICENIATISDLSIYQRTDGSRLVDIYYNLTTTDTTKVFVRVEVSTDSGISYQKIPYNKLSGDVGWVSSGIDKHIIWDISNDSRKYEGFTYKLKLIADDNKNVLTNKRFLALGNADFFDEDYLIIMPLLRKYNFTQTFYVQARPSNNNPNLSTYNTEWLQQIFNQNSTLADHMFAHFSPITAFPLGDGYTTPTDADLTMDRGDGKNAFGIPLQSTLGSLIPYSYFISGNSYANTPFANLTHQNCEDIRKSLSVFRRPTAYSQGSNVRLLEALDYLSNLYLGTTGTGRNIVIPSNGNNLPVYGDSILRDSEGRIAGGIFQGCYTTANHECWERIVKLHSLFYSNLLGREFHAKGWFSCGGPYRFLLYRNVGTLYNTGPSYMNSNKTLLSSVYTRLLSTRTNEYRSLYDILLSEGYITGFEAHLDTPYDGRPLTHFLYANKLNSGSFWNNYNCLSHPNNLIYRYYTNENGFSPIELSQLAATNNQLRWLYERDKAMNFTGGRGLYNTINNIIKWITWGTIPQYADDSGQGTTNTQARRQMLAIQIDNLFKFCYLAGIQIISYEEAIEKCRIELPNTTNFFPNPSFDKTIDDVIGSTLYPQQTPDGWIENNPSCLSVNYDNSIQAVFLSVLPNSSAYIRQYMIAPGTLILSFKAKGNGFLKVYGIQNKTPINATTNNMNLLATININSSEWSTYSINIDIPLLPVSEPTDQFVFCQGRDNQICGLQFELSSTDFASGIQFALPNLKKQ